MYSYDHVCVLVEPNITTNSKYGTGNGPIIYSNLNCQGWQRSFSECSKSTYRHFTCSSTNIAGVLCTDGKYTQQYTVEELM